MCALRRWTYEALDVGTPITSAGSQRTEVARLVAHRRGSLFQPTSPRAPDWFMVWLFSTSLAFLFIFIFIIMLLNLVELSKACLKFVFSTSCVGCWLASEVLFFSSSLIFLLSTVGDALNFYRLLQWKREGLLLLDWRGMFFMHIK